MPVLTSHQIRTRSAKPGMQMPYSVRDENDEYQPQPPVTVTAVYEFKKRDGRETVLLVFEPCAFSAKPWFLQASPGELLEVAGPRPKRTRAVKS